MSDWLYRTNGERLRWYHYLWALVSVVWTAALMIVVWSVMAYIGYWVLRLIV